MTYKLLLIDDCNNKSLSRELADGGLFAVESYNPHNLEDTLDKIEQGKYDLLVIDFRLTSKENRFDAPALAQCIRTPGGQTFLETPVVLISSEANIPDLYKGLSTLQLFDYSLTKKTYLENARDYNCYFNSIIAAYKARQDKRFSIEDILVPPSGISIPESLIETLKTPEYTKNVHSYFFLILNEIIRAIGILIGEDVLSARLGVSKDSPGWERIKEDLSPYVYNGICSDVYKRWWARGIELWWADITGKPYLKRLTSGERVDVLKRKTGLNLIPLELPEGAQSSCFWTICYSLKKPLDPIEGYELNGIKHFPWQDQPLVSFLAAQRSDINYRRFASSEAKKRFRDEYKRRQGC